jgi:hypothetical protein
LREVARRARGVWSGVAATALFGFAAYHRESLGLMRWVLDQGDLEAQQWMVNQVYNFSGQSLHHAFTADGLDEARCWLDLQLQGGGFRPMG